MSMRDITDFVVFKNGNFFINLVDEDGDMWPLNMVFTVGEPFKFKHKGVTRNGVVRHDEIVEDSTMIPITVV
jgi:hypothetical protein